MDTGAVVVAAGMSSRMGDFKPMLSIGSISVAQRVVATLKQAGAARVVVVTGYNAEELERHLASSGVVFLRNENYRTTHMFDSALIGLRYLRDKCRQVLTRPVVQVSICREKRFLDPRVAMLLTLTDETQSVRAACQRMQLSYSSGWNAINLLEAELGYPVVARTQGGQRGGRSSLTARGRALLRAYEAYTLRLRAMADELFVQYFPDLFK